MNELLDVIMQYLEIFPEENNRQQSLIKFLSENCNVTDWNNFNGHIVAGGFIYAEKERKFLVLYHKELEMFLYPGGHINENDLNILEAAKREIYEETGLVDLKQYKNINNELIPIDIDTHTIKRNIRRNLPEHHHFEFRYLFGIDKIKDINIDTEELGKFKWIDIEEMKRDKNYGIIADKIEKILSKSLKIVN